MQISEFQNIIEETYFDRDSKRGLAINFVWFIEEVGELAKELKKTLIDSGDEERLKEEFADVLAWLTTLASQMGFDLEEIAHIYAEGCPKCHQKPCVC